MLIGIHKDRLGKISDSIQVYEQILDYNNIKHIRLDINEPDFGEKVRTLYLFIFRWNVATDLKEIAKSIMPVIQNYLHIKCFPDYATSWHYDDKIKEYYLLKQHGFPVIDSTIFWDKQKALDWIETADFPLVFKLKAGSESRNVVFVKNKRLAERLIIKMFGNGINPNELSFNTKLKIKGFAPKKILRDQALKLYRFYKGEDISPFWEKHKNYILFQKYLPNNPFDTRVTVIGDRAYAILRYNRKNDFRASGSGKYDFNKSKINMQCLEIAFEISDRLKFQSMAYDFLYNEKNEPVISEISYTFPSRSQFEEPGYWDRKFQYHSGHYWAEYFQIMDVLERPDLCQPKNIIFRK